jgi:hypothetical protein
VAIVKSSVPLGEKSSSAVLDRAMTHSQHHYLFQMPRWDKRLRIVLDWTVALFFRPDITKVGLEVEREQVRRSLQMAGRSIETGRGATWCPCSERHLHRIPL